MNEKLRQALTTMSTEDMDKLAILLQTAVIDRANEVLDDVFDIMGLAQIDAFNDIISTIDMAIDEGRANHE